jgi:hypothetical protein
MLKALSLFDVQKPASEVRAEYLRDSAKNGDVYRLMQRWTVFGTPELDFLRLIADTRPLDPDHARMRHIAQRFVANLTNPRVNE